MTVIPTPEQQSKSSDPEWVCLPTTSENYELINDLDHRGQYYDDGELSVLLRVSEYKKLRAIAVSARSARGELAADLNTIEHHLLKDQIGAAREVIARIREGLK